MFEPALFSVSSIRGCGLELGRCRDRQDAAPTGSRDRAGKFARPRTRKSARRSTDELAAEIREVEKSVREAREHDLIARHSVDENFLNRWRIAKLKLATGDRDARVEMATLLKQRVRSVVLTPEKHLIVTFTNNRRNSPTIKVEIRTDGQR